MKHRPSWTSGSPRTELESQLTRGNLKADAKIYGQTRAVDGHLYLDWALDFARHGDTVVHTLRGHHLRAHEGSAPIVPTHEPAERHERRPRGRGAPFGRFGIREEVALPPQPVVRLTVEGPDWLSQDLTDVAVVWSLECPAHLEGAAADMEFLNNDSAITASYGGRMYSGGAASLGRSVGRST
ncbi:hypothetical protein ACFQ6Q_16365 [Streptomyces sp. NPDC056437]|uniref:hypothetical protein n=1 Tax=Streptomyces sp. NPDC056437 TaxID=3345816 RepID=UPI00369F857B